MPSLKESENVEAMQAMHREIWDKLQEQDEKVAEYFLRKYLKKADRHKSKREHIDSLYDFFREKWLFLSILTGLISGPILVCILIWIALWVE